jgi:hypothetical protein
MSNEKQVTEDTLVDNKDVDYNLEYDSYYNIKTGEWLESKCSDPKCTFCVNRPLVAPF